MIKGILFDMGGTLIDNINLDMHRVFAYLLDYFHLDHNEENKGLIDLCFHPLYTRKKTEEVSFLDLLTDYVKRLGIDYSSDQIQALEIECNRRLSEVRLVPNIVPLLEKFKKMNLKMVVLSNSCFSEKALIDILDQFDLTQYFEKVLVSSSFYVKKPSSRFYKEGLKALGLNANEVIMIGDTYEADVVGSSVSKIKSIYYNHKNEERSFKNKYLLKMIKNYDELSQSDETFEEIILKKYISNGAMECVHLLQENGYEAYVVGGATRNALLGLPINDYDITTSALPETVQDLFAKHDYKVILTGVKHGTVTVIKKSVPYEITTFRSDGKYLDNRHPDHVEFGVKLEEDLLRRDFTINALCFDGVHLIDHFHGVDDLNHRCIRAVGVASSRFKEDALRILRAIRFACYLGFTIEEETSASILSLYPLLENIAYERINEEILKILSYNCHTIVSKYHVLFEYVYHYSFENNPHVDKLALLDSKKLTVPMKFALCGPKLDESYRDLRLPTAFSLEVMSYQDFTEDADYDLYHYRLDRCKYKKEYIFNIIQYCSCIFNWNSDKMKRVKSYMNASVDYPDGVNEIAYRGKNIMKYGFSGEDIKKVKEEILDEILKDHIPNDFASIQNYLNKKYNKNY